MRTRFCCQTQARCSPQNWERRPGARTLAGRRIAIKVIFARRHQREETTNRKGGEEVPHQLKQKPQGRLWFRNVRTDLSPSMPTKLADGLGLKDTLLALRDTPRLGGSSVFSFGQREIRQTTYLIIANIPQCGLTVKCGLRRGLNT